MKAVKTVALASEEDLPDTCAFPLSATLFNRSKMSKKCLPK